jgi:hypothetical protein
MNSWLSTKIIREPAIAALAMLAPPFIRGALQALAQQVAVAEGVAR